MSYLGTLSPSRVDKLLRLAGQCANGGRQPPASQQGQQRTQAAALEVARLRAAAKSAAAEQDSLRRKLAAVVEQSTQLDRELQALRHTSVVRQQRSQERHAAQVAELEEQRRVQRRAMLDLAAAAEGLARENAELHARLVALQDEHEDGSHVQGALQERLGQLQALCLQLEGQQPRQQQERAAGGSAGAAGLGEPRAARGLQAGVLEVLSSTLRALGPANGARAAKAAAGPAKPPPATAPDKVKAATRGLPTDLRLALRELEALRREREALAAQLRGAEAQVLKLQGERRELQQSLAQQRHAAAATAADLQRQLKAARSRVEGMARRCKEKDAALAERDAFVAKLERRLLQRCQLPAAARPGSRGLGASAQGAGQTAPNSEQAGGLPHASSSDASSWQAAAGAPACLPGAHLLAYLSPDPSPSAWLPREEQHAWQEQAEQQLQEQPWERHGHTAEGAVGGGTWGAEAAAPDASPGAAGLVLGSSPEELPPRRLHWATPVGHAGWPAQHAQQGYADCSVPAVAAEQAGWQHEAGQDEGWAAYQLGSPSPSRPAAGPPHWSLGGAPQAGAQLGCGSSNPLFSFHSQPAGPAGRAAGGAAAAAEERATPQAGSSCWRPNELFCSPPQQPLQPQQRRQQQLRQRSSDGAEALGQLPPRMPSGDFSSVSALLEALGPAPQQAQQQMRAEQHQPQAVQRGPPQVRRAAAAAAEEASVADTPSLPGIRWLAAGCPPTEDAIEQKLQAAVACFFAESAQKGQGGRRPAEPADAPSQQLQHRWACSATCASASVGAAADCTGRGRSQEPALKHGRPNRATDRQGRRGSMAHQHG